MAAFCLTASDCPNSDMESDSSRLRNSPTTFGPKLSPMLVAWFGMGHQLQSVTTVLNMRQYGRYQPTTEVLKPAARATEKMFGSSVQEMRSSPSTSVAE